MSSNSNFSYTTVNGLTVLEFAPWAKRGIVHGFIGKASDGGGAMSVEEKLRLAFGVESHVCPKQSHGNSVIDLRNSSSRASLDGDSIIVSRRATSSKVAYSIGTADCLPIFMLTGNDMALIHAGWRGLANGILPRTIEAIKEPRGEPVEVVIGPAAGPLSYEVGAEVIDAIGRPFAIFERKGEKFLLDMPGTARQIVKSSLGDSVVVHNSETCTMGNLLFESYRRDGKNAGRNLAFFIPC